MQKGRSNLPQTFVPSFPISSPFRSGASASPSLSISLTRECVSLMAGGNGFRVAVLLLLLTILHYPISVLQIFYGLQMFVYFVQGDVVLHASRLAVSRERARIIKMGAQQRHWMHTFDIDTYFNPITPRPRFYILPKYVSHWFGYRAPVQSHQKQNHTSSVLLVWLFSFLGAFIGISIIENVFLRLPHLDGHPVPIVIASFGAAAILEYNTIESPLSQPRNLILGHLLSAAVGVGITKLFHMLPEARFEDLRWVAGALAVGSASTIMSITKTIHPPAGATALLAATTPELTELGWWLLLLVLLASVLMLVSAMLVNNLYKRFPLYWWTPVDLGSLNEKEQFITATDAEKADSGSSINSGSEAGLKKNAFNAPRNGSDAAAFSHREDGTLDEEQRMRRKIHSDPAMKVQIELDRIVIPDWMELSQWEAEVLEEFQSRLRGKD